MADHCGDAVKIKDARGHLVTLHCARDHGHPVAGYNGDKRPFEFHRGDGWVWDERCAWVEGGEPVWTPRRRS